MEVVEQGVEVREMKKGRGEYVGVRGRCGKWHRV